MSLHIDVGVEWREAAVSGLDEPAARALLQRAVVATLRARGVTEAQVSLALVDDETIAGLNATYLGRDGPTDVLAFALHEPEEAPVGDIYVGYEQALRQARELDVPAEEELVRLAVHGTLHVLGFQHPEDENREDSPMWREQERIVTELLGP